MSDIEAPPTVVLEAEIKISVPVGVTEWRFTTTRVGNAVVASPIERVIQPAGRSENDK